MFKKEEIVFKLINSICKECRYAEITNKSEIKDLKLYSNLRNDIFYKCYFYYINGNIFEGFVNNNISFVGIGKFIWKNGNIYEGEFYDGQMKGKGNFFWNDKSQYEGEIWDGYRHGYGIFKTKKNLIYKGYWEKGLRHGKGSIIYPNNDSFEGEFISGLRHGKGVMNYQENGKFLGEYKFDKKNGYGIYNFQNGEIYKGFWENNKFNGFGFYYYLDYENLKIKEENKELIFKKSKNKKIINKYYGYFRDGLRNYFGLFFYSNGGYYLGEFKENSKEGFGIYIDQFGSLTEGIWQNDKIIKNFKKNFFSNNLNKNIDIKKIEKGNNTIKEITEKSKRNINSKRKVIKENNNSKILNNSIENKLPKYETMEELNPYKNILRLKNLFHQFKLDKNYKNEFQEKIEIIFFRHHSLLVKIFNHLENLVKKEINLLEIENIVAQTNTLDINIFWFLIEKFKIQKNYLNIKNFNKLYLENIDNNIIFEWNHNFFINKFYNIKKKRLYSLSENKEDLKNLEKLFYKKFIKIRLIKINYDNKINYNELYNNFENQYKLDEEAENLINQSLHFSINEKNIHKNNVPVLFYNFIDGIIRMNLLYYKYDFNILISKIEKFILNKLNKVLELKEITYKNDNLFTDNPKRKKIFYNLINNIFEGLNENKSRSFYNRIDKFIISKNLINLLKFNNIIDFNETSIYHNLFSKDKFIKWKNTKFEMLIEVLNSKTKEKNTILNLNKELKKKNKLLKKIQEQKELKINEDLKEISIKSDDDKIIPDNLKLNIDNEILTCKIGISILKNKIFKELNYLLSVTLNKYDLTNILIDFFFKINNDENSLYEYIYNLEKSVKGFKNKKKDKKNKNKIRWFIHSKKNSIANFNSNKDKKDILMKKLINNTDENYFKKILEYS